MSASSKPTPIALPNELSAKIERVAALMDKSKADVMRLAMEIGLEDLRRINYNVAGAVLDAARSKKIVTMSPDRGAHEAPGLNEQRAGYETLPPVEITPGTVRSWLRQIQKDSAWLAAQVKRPLAQIEDGLDKGFSAGLQKAIAGLMAASHD